MSIRSFNGKKPLISHNAFIDPTAVIIGDVQIGDESSIWPFCVIRGDIHSISIGKRSNIQDGTIIHVTHAGSFNPKGASVWIGDEVIVGHQVVLHGCTIHGHSLIGIGSKILDNAVIEPEVMIGAGSLVPPGKILEGGFLWLGSPVKKIRPLTPAERDFLRYSANYYVELGKQHAKECKNATSI